MLDNRPFLGSRATAEQVKVCLNNEPSIKYNKGGVVKGASAGELSPVVSAVQLAPVLIAIADAQYLGVLRVTRAR